MTAAGPPAVLEMWTVYRGAVDVGEPFCVRRWDVTAEGPRPGPMFPAATLTDARSHVPPDLYRVPRQEDDDPVVVETWM